MQMNNLHKMAKQHAAYFENCGAASVIRTRDLTLTKGALYRWSYGSTLTRFTILACALQD